MWLRNTIGTVMMLCGSLFALSGCGNGTDVGNPTQQNADSSTTAFVGTYAHGNTLSTVGDSCSVNECNVLSSICPTAATQFSIATGSSAGSVEISDLFASSVAESPITGTVASNALSFLITVTVTAGQGPFSCSGSVSASTLTLECNLVISGEITTCDYTFTAQ